MRSLILLFIFSVDSTRAASRDESAIPVVEIRGEGKPMSAAQIRHLEEMSNGGPLDIKIERQSKPRECGHQAEKNDFITFHFKLYLEDGRRVYSTHSARPVSIQVGYGMTIPGLDKGLEGVCKGEQRRVSVPWRLAQKESRGKLWKDVPSEEHWIRFDVDVIEVTPFSLAEQFKRIDMDGNTFICQKDLSKFADGQKEEFGKTWPNEDIDNVVAARYYIRYFDVNGDGSIDFGEFQKIIERDENTIKSKVKKAGKTPEGARREHGFAWILDFDNDGFVTSEETEEAPERLEKGPKLRASKKTEL